MKERRVFDHIAKLIKIKRRALSPKVSQQGLSYRLGYKNGQFISNIERGLCSVPLRSLNSICDVLKVSKEELRDALLRDYAETLDNYFAQSEDSEEVATNTFNSNENENRETKKSFEFARNYVV